MRAVKLKGEVTGDGRLVLELPEEVEPGPVEVIVLQEARKAPSSPRKRAGKIVHPAFGMWADREEAQDPGSFAAELRRKLEQRADSRG